MTLRTSLARMITDPKIASKFMAKQHKYLRLKDFRLGYIFENLLGHAVGTANGERHKRIRGMFDRAYSTHAVAQNLGMMEEECKQFFCQTLRAKQVSIT